MQRSKDDQVDNDQSKLDREAIYAWLKQLLEVQRARLASTDVDSQFEAALATLEHTCDLLQGGIWQRDAPAAVRSLIATGVADWQRSERMPEDVTAPWLLARLARGALWPLVIAPKLPDKWFTALRSISSPEVAVSVSNARAVMAHGDARLIEAEFQQHLAESRCARGIVNIVQDLSDPSGGWPFLEVLLTTPDGGVRPLKPQDKSGLLRFLIAGASFVATAAAAGVIGNRIDALLVELWNQLFPLGTPPPALPPPIEEPQRRGQRPQPRPAWPPAIFYMQFCFVPAGPFWMGSPDSDPDAQDIEKPLHQVDIRYDYWIGRYPVTVSQFSEFVFETEYRTRAERESIDYTWHSSGRDNPVIQLSWRDALAYCHWLASRAGLPIQLPSEAEWEKAARGGLTIPAQSWIATVESGLAPASVVKRHNPLPRRRYPWGDAPPVRSRCNSPVIGYDTTPVGRYSPLGDSPYGCADMAGNLGEWTRSLWRRNVGEPAFRYPYHADDGRENLQAGDDVLHVLRGGSFFYDRDGVRCAVRYGFYPTDGFGDIGFRIVVSPIFPTSAI